MSKKRKKKQTTIEPRYPIVLYPAEEGGYVAEIPVLRGCLAQGETPEECLNELAKVQALWIETAKRNNETLPSADEVLAKLRKMVA